MAGAARRTVVASAPIVTTSVHRVYRRTTEYQYDCEFRRKLSFEMPLGHADVSCTHVYQSGCHLGARNGELPRHS